MISYNRFYELFHELFCLPNYLNSFGFIPTASTCIKHLTYYTFSDKFNFNFDCNGRVIWWCEEPLNIDDFEDLQYYPLKTDSVPWDSNFQYPLGTNSMITPIHCHLASVQMNIVANSEKSNLKKALFKKYKYYDWYFFFHGFAALDWFRDFQYVQKSDIQISKLFICLNHILDKKRSYRLNLLNEIFKEDLQTHGYVSASKLTKNLIKQEIFDPYSQLSKKTKKDIYENLYQHAEPIVLDNKKSLDIASADIIDLKLSLGSLWHIVTETVFYDEKLHLTEKIFKPIVLQRPFILIGAPGNLEYLKEYGFQTFDRWINEDYDKEPDPDLRIKKVITEIKKLQGKNLKEMYNEMLPVLEYNHKHFYGKFREIIIDEALKNFQNSVYLYNKDLSDRFRLPQSLDYTEIKKRLMSN